MQADFVFNAKAVLSVFELLLLRDDALTFYFAPVKLVSFSVSKFAKVYERTETIRLKCVV